MSLTPPSTPKDQEIVLFKVGEFSHVNANVQEFLSSEFPNYSLTVVDVLKDILARQPLDWLHAVAQAVTLYPKQIFLHARKPTDFLLRTPAAFDAIKKSVGKWIDQTRTVFTFQTQSLFDASHPSTPHFVYTDHTSLARLRYRLTTDPELLNSRWIDRERMIYEAARINFSTSHFACYSMVNDYAIDPRRIACTFSGTNTSPHIPPTSKDFRGVILFVGIDWARKGGPDLIEAFLRLVPKFPSAELRIVGCTPPVIHPQIRAFGKLTIEETSKQFRDADIFCMPSYQEPSAVALVEAQLYGLPVVSTNVGGSRDRLIDGQTGFLVEPGDITGLTAALDQLLSDPIRSQAMGKAGVAFAEDRFTWKGVGKTIADQIRTSLACQ